jgi:hypothetical protein
LWSSVVLPDQPKLWDAQTRQHEFFFIRLGGLVGGNLGADLHLGHEIGAQRAGSTSTDSAFETRIDVTQRQAITIA